MPLKDAVRLSEMLEERMEVEKKIMKAAILEAFDEVL